MLSFHLDFQQITEIEVQLQNLTLKMNGIRNLENQTYYSVFSIKTGHHNLHSLPSINAKGLFNKNENVTVFIWESNDDIEDE